MTEEVCKWRFLMKCNFFRMNCIILDEAGCEIGMVHASLFMQVYKSFALLQKALMIATIMADVRP